MLKEEVGAEGGRCWRRMVLKEEVVIGQGRLNSGCVEWT